MSTMGHSTDIPDVTYRSDVTVRLVKHSASDRDILWAARVSTQGETDQDGPDGNINGKRDVALVRYLMRDRHGSPFEHNMMTFYVEAPIFVFREFHRHRIGFSYNEVSGRYRQLDPTCYVPGPERNLVQTPGSKPGEYLFEPGTPELYGVAVDIIEGSMYDSFRAYHELLENGVAKEVARIVLPVGTFSAMYVTCNARSLMSFLSLRTKREDAKFPSFPQREIEMVAEQMEDIWKDLMPVTWAAFCENGRVHP